MPGRTGTVPRSTDGDLLVGARRRRSPASSRSPARPRRPVTASPTPCCSSASASRSSSLIGARAPWWAAAVAAGVALAIAVDPLLIGVAVVGLAAALWAGATRRDRPVVLAASLGVTLQRARCEPSSTAGSGVSAAISWRARRAGRSSPASGRCSTARAPAVVGRRRRSSCSSPARATRRLRLRGGEVAPRPRQPG